MDNLLSHARNVELPDALAAVQMHIHRIKCWLIGAVGPTCRYCVTFSCEHSFFAKGTDNALARRHAAMLYAGIRCPAAYRANGFWDLDTLSRHRIRNLDLDICIYFVIFRN